MSDPELTAQQEDQVRRMLALVRHDEPIPADVADRLDRVLADLPIGMPAEGGNAPVVDLAARRRRRNAAALLAGAAAVIVGGFAAGQVIVGGGPDNEAGSSTQSVNRDAGGGQGDALSQAPAGADDGAAPESAAAGPTLKLSSKHLQRDLAEQLPRVTADGAVPAPQAAETLGCSTPTTSAYGTGRFFAAYYDGIPAVVALRPPAGSTQRADVLECSTAAELGSATLPSR